MENFDQLYPPQKVSYLQARDPSILSWNRYGMEKVRHNLANDFASESTIPSIKSEKEDNHIKVYLRIKSNVDDEGIYTIEGDTLLCKVPQGSNSARNHRDNNCIIKKYEFTQIFGPSTEQQHLFNEIIKPKILNFINGYNNTLLAYGASGAGKTFTMVGTAEQPGIIPRALEYLFRTIPILPLQPSVKPLSCGKVVFLNEYEREVEKQHLLSILPQAWSEKSLHIKTYKAMQQRLSNDSVATVESSPSILSVWVSMAEIYNEFIYDLLQPTPPRGQERSKLKIGGLQDNIYIKGLKYIYVKSGMEAYQVLQYGINNLKYADTSVNMHSSRSHCIFSIRLVQGTDIDNSIVSTFNFCDLAGSERQKKTMNVGDRLKESRNINSSLLVLGRCITNIRDGQLNKDKMPPFRESKLTQLFQRALMGKEDIFMIININPSRDVFDESQHTLNFAGIAKDIIIENLVPKILKPNRFSMCLNGSLPYIEEDEREEELRELRNEKASLILELSELRQKYEENVEAERQHLIQGYRYIIDVKDSQIKKLEMENKRLLEEKSQPQVIVLSDDESDDEELISLRNENKKFKSQVYNFMEDMDKLRYELKQKDNLIASLKKKLEESTLTIEDAKSDFRAIYKQNEELSSEVVELKKEIYKLNDESNLQNIEIESLRHFMNIDRENIEQLEDEKQQLLLSVTVTSPLSLTIGSPINPKPVSEPDRRLTFT